MILASNEGGCPLDNNFLEVCGLVSHSLRSVVNKINAT